MSDTDIKVWRISLYATDEKFSQIERNGQKFSYKELCTTVYSTVYSNQLIFLSVIVVVGKSNIRREQSQSSTVQPTPPPPSFSPPPWFGGQRGDEYTTPAGSSCSSSSSAAPHHVPYTPLNYIGRVWLQVSGPGSRWSSRLMESSSISSAGPSPQLQQQQK